MDKIENVPEEVVHHIPVSPTLIDSLRNEKNVINIEKFAETGFEVREMGRLGNHRTIQLIIISDGKEKQE